jgi:hypothetical protein
VTTVAEAKGKRTPDLAACGVTVEVKAFGTLEQREGAVPSARQVANKLLVARGQGAVAVVWGRGSGLNEDAAWAGFDLFCQRAAEKGMGRLRSARVVGDGFDITFSPAERLRPAHRLAAHDQGRRLASKPSDPPDQPSQRKRPPTAPSPSIQRQHGPGPRPQGRRHEPPRLSM